MGTRSSPKRKGSGNLLLSEKDRSRSRELFVERGGGAAEPRSHSREHFLSAAGSRTRSSFPESKKMGCRSSPKRKGSGNLLLSEKDRSRSRELFVERGGGAAEPRSHSREHFLSAAGSRTRSSFPESKKMGCRSSPKRKGSGNLLLSENSGNHSPRTNIFVFYTLNRSSS